MIRAALEYLTGLAKKVEPIAFDGIYYAAIHADDQKIVLPPEEPRPTPLVVSSLRGLVQFAKKNIDGLDLTGHVLFVTDPKSVQLLGPLTGRHRRREMVVGAAAELPQVPFGRYVDLEQFIILLQTAFLQTEDQGKVLQVLKHLKRGTEVHAEDDGTTQRVTVKSGIEVVRETAVPNPVSLKPYRTFTEVEQPSSLFVLRLRATPGDTFEAALFEADGGAWAVHLRDRVADALRLMLAEAEVALEVVG